MTTPRAEQNKIAQGKTYYRITEIAEILGVASSTLRYWEQEFSLIRPEYTSAGHRRYSAKDLELLRLIKHLLRDKGLSIEYARKELEKTYRKYPPRKPLLCDSSKVALRLLEEAKNRCEKDAHTIARIEAVERWINEMEPSK